VTWLEDILTSKLPGSFTALVPLLCPGKRLDLYLADDCCLVSDSTRRSLRSADVPTCVVPRTLNSYGNRTFAAAGPRLWNSLPAHLRYAIQTSPTDCSDDSWTDTFFGKHERNALWLLIMRRLRKTLALA